MAKLVQRDKRGAKGVAQALPNFQELLEALKALEPGEKLRAEFDTPRTRRSFETYIYTHQKGLYKLIRRQEDSFVTVERRRYRHVRQGYGERKQVVFNRILEAFVRAGVVHYTKECVETKSICSRCKRQQTELNHQQIQAVTTAGDVVCEPTQAGQSTS